MMWTTSDAGFGYTANLGASSSGTSSDIGVPITLMLLNVTRSPLSTVMFAPVNLKRIFKSGLSLADVIALRSVVNPRYASPSGSVDVIAADVRTGAPDDVE